jgi:hypothetical protein
MLTTELNRHLDTEAAIGKTDDQRNGSSKKTLTMPEGEVLAVVIMRSRWSAFVRNV